MNSAAVSVADSFYEICYYVWFGFKVTEEEFHVYALGGQISTPAV